MSEPVRQLLESAREMRWRVPELALLLGDRAAAQARGSGDVASRLRAEALALSASNRLGRGVAATERAITAVRDAERGGHTDSVAELRVELACCARASGSHDVALRVLHPVLEMERLQPGLRAHALTELSAALPAHRRAGESAEALDEAERLYTAETGLDRDTARLLRARVNAARAGHHRRHADLPAAAGAAEAGIALLDHLGDPTTDSGELRLSLVLEQVHTLLDLGRHAEALHSADSVLLQPLRAAAAAPAGWLRFALATRVRAPQGDHRAAVGLLTEALAGAKRHDLGDLQAELLCSLSHLHESGDDLAEALRCLREAYAADRRWRASVHGSRVRLLEEFPAAGNVAVGASWQSPPQQAQGTGSGLRDSDETEPYAAHRSAAPPLEGNRPPARAAAASDRKPVEPWEQGEDGRRIASEPERSGVSAAAASESVRTESGRTGQDSVARTGRRRRDVAEQRVPAEPPAPVQQPVREGAHPAPVAPDPDTTGRERSATPTDLAEEIRNAAKRHVRDSSEDAETRMAAWGDRPAGAPEAEWKSSRTSPESAPRAPRSGRRGADRAETEQPGDIAAAGPVPRWPSAEPSVSSSGEPELQPEVTAIMPVVPGLPETGLPEASSDSTNPAEPDYEGRTAQRTESGDEPARSSPTDDPPADAAPADATPSAAGHAVPSGRDAPERRDGPGSGTELRESPPDDDHGDIAAGEHQRRARGRSPAEIRASLGMSDGGMSDGGMSDGGTSDRARYAPGEREEPSPQTEVPEQSGRRRARHAEEESDSVATEDAGSGYGGDFLTEHRELLRDLPSIRVGGGQEESNGQVGLADLLAEALVAYRSGRNGSPGVAEQAVSTRRPEHDVGNGGGESHPRGRSESRSAEDASEGLPRARHRHMADSPGEGSRSWTPPVQ